MNCFWPRKIAVKIYDDDFKSQVKSKLSDLLKIIQVSEPYTARTIRKSVMLVNGTVATWKKKLFNMASGLSKLSAQDVRDLGPKGPRA